MKQVTTLKIDGAFPGFSGHILEEMLERGWIIIDKTIIQQRYIVYVLGRDEVPGDAGSRK